MAKVTEIPAIHHRLYMKRRSSVGPEIDPISTISILTSVFVEALRAYSTRTAMRHDRLSCRGNLLLAPVRTDVVLFFFFFFLAAITGHMAQTNLHSRR